MKILIAVVVLAGAGGGGYFYFLKGDPAAGAEAGAEHEPEPEHEAPAKGGTGVVPMEPFVVNLADPGGTRFLRVNLSLVVQDEEHAKEVEESAVEMARMRSAILELLALQHADALVTPEGKSELKTAIAESVQHVAHETKVSDVLFSEFVVQY